jgi:phage shock protein PspC (stress-responsive transcriptional regulator)
MAAGARGRHEQEARRRARRTGAVGFVGALALPIVLWHGVIAGIASEFHADPRYLIAGWAPWALMAGGLLCLVVAAIVDWRERSRRFYSAGSRAWVGWGLSLYILGFALATQVAQIADSLGRS